MISCTGYASAHPGYASAYPEGVISDDQKTVRLSENGLKRRNVKSGIKMYPLSVVVKIWATRRAGRGATRNDVKVGSHYSCITMS